MASGAMTRIELESEVMFNALNEGYRVRVGRWLNDAVVEVCRKLDLSRAVEVAPVTAGVAVTTLRFYRVREVWEAVGPATTDPTLVAARARAELAPLPTPDRQSLGGSVGGFYEAAYAGTVDDRPALAIRPTGTVPFVAITGLVTPPAMSLDSHESGLGAELDQALIAFARAHAFKLEDDFNLAAMWQAEFLERLRAAAPVNLNHTDGPITVPGMEGGYGTTVPGGG